jgi:hypothetical protein
MILPARMSRGFAPVAMVLSFIAGSGGVQGEDRLGSPANPGRILKSRRRHVLIKLNAEVARSFKDISDRNCWRDSRFAGCGAKGPCRIGGLVLACPLWVKSGRDALKFRCPLYPRKTPMQCPLWAKGRHSGIGLPARRAKYSIIQSRRGFRSLFHLYTAAGLFTWNSYAFICTSAAASARSLRALKSAVRS